MCSLVEHCFCFLAWRKRSCASSAALSNLITNQRRDKRSCCEPPLKTGIKVWESWWKSPQPFQQIPSARMHLFVSGLSNLCSPPLSFFFLFSSRAYLLWLQSLVCPLRGSDEVRTSWYSRDDTDEGQALVKATENQKQDHRRCMEAESCINYKGEHTRWWSFYLCRET